MNAIKGYKRGLEWGRCGLFRGAIACLAVTLLSWHHPAAGQVIENPAQPRAKNAGRVIVPNEVLAISDEGRTDFYFKWPGNLRVAPNGFLFVRDEKQFLQFDKDGRFLRNLFKKGQGPGEMGSFVGCFLTDKNVIALANDPDKLLWFNYAGEYERETAIRGEGGTFLWPLAQLNGVFYLNSSQIPDLKGEPGIIDVPQVIVALADGSGEPKSLASFMTKAFVVTSGGGSARGMISISFLGAVPYQKRFLALFHTSEYLLKIYDPAANTVQREFRRAYERVKKPPEKDEQKKDRIGINGKTFTAPEQKYANDIVNIFARGGEIWAVTSTRDKVKGVLIDVFDNEGIYQDCFYLQLPEAALRSLVSPSLATLDGDSLYVIAKNADETSTIRKYAIK
jgi:hypothetical protein